MTGWLGSLGGRFVVLSLIVTLAHLGDSISRGMWTYTPTDGFKGKSTWNHEFYQHLFRVFFSFKVGVPLDLGSHSLGKSFGSKNSEQRCILNHAISLVRRHLNPQGHGVSNSSHPEITDRTSFPTKGPRLSRTIGISTFPTKGPRLSRTIGISAINPR